MKLLFELSGENPTLPLAELDCIGSVSDSRKQVAVAECANPSVASRLSLTHTVLEYLGECLPDITAFSSLLSDLALTEEHPFAGRVKKIHSSDDEPVKHCSQRDFERLIGTKIDGNVNLLRAETEYRAILSGDRCYFGKVIMRINRSAFDQRNPGKRDFFHPGVMMPRLARALVNISCVQPGECLLDPFCGTGGILIEAKLIGTTTIGCDFDPFMIQGCHINTGSGTLCVADATALPVKDRSVEAVVTDLPYGQSVCIRKAGTMEHLYERALAETSRVLRKGRRAVIVTHRDISGIASQHMSVIQRHEQRVHKSLTRRVLVLEC